MVRRLMREEGLEVVYNRRRRRWSSYAGEVSAAPPNLVARDFSAPAPDELWVTDITEFRIPAGKAYLSAVVDCFDGRPAGWEDRAVAHGGPGQRLARGRGRRQARGRPHRGAQRPGRPLPLARLGRAVRGGRPGPLHVRQGLQPRQRRCEGFFGRLKNEFFHCRDWEGVPVAEFGRRLDAYLRYYCSGRIKRSLGWLSPDEYRASLGYAV